ncbi:GIY-YIG nuclease family protein, partial [Salmonella enterica]|uniref:GIY-YIG nuclease family protein n=1 Tax=Salmonella enterica TaxID=28901 RepID=UPI003D768840
MYTVYILRSNTDNKRYIGFTDNLDRRLVEHNSGKVKSTKHRQPLALIYSEQFQSK